MVSARVCDPVSSFRAADRHTDVRVSETQDNVLMLVGLLGPITAEDMEQQYARTFNKPRISSRWRSCLPELKRKGLLRHADTELPNSAGQLVTAWEVA